MILLSIETTAQTASVALLRDDALLLELTCDPTKKHAETVLAGVKTLLGKAELPLTAVDAFAVDVGPGSFTGVRIGVCTANALAFACHKQVIAVNALEAMYQSCLPTEKRVCTLVDARNGNAYAAQYQHGECIDPPCAVELDAYCAPLCGAVRFVGDVASLCGQLTYPTAAAVGFVALRRVANAQAEARPLYLRPSQAERLAGDQK